MQQVILFTNADNSINIEYSLWFCSQEVLPDVDSIIYADIDTVFMRPLVELWNDFHKFSDDHLMAMSRENEMPHHGVYPRAAKFPYVPPSGN